MQELVTIYEANEQSNTSPLGRIVRYIAVKEMYRGWMPVKELSLPPHTEWGGSLVGYITRTSVDRSVL